MDRVIRLRYQAVVTPLVLPVLLGMAHGVADCGSGLLLGALALRLTGVEAGSLLLLYNALAFGGQPLVGLVVDRSRQPQLVAIAGLLLLVASLVVAPWQAAGAVALAGLGSAAFHVGGGALALCATPGRAAGPGVFAAPGVLGLAVGGALVLAGYTAVWPVAVALLALAIALRQQPIPVLPYAAPTSEPVLERHDVVMIALLAAIALRSAVWNAALLVAQGRIELLLALGVAAACGKFMGGLLADQIGWRRWTIGALAFAVPLLSFGAAVPLALCAGVALLQSATPPALALLFRFLPRQPGLAAGLALGFAIALGGVPALGGLVEVWPPPGIMAAVISIIAALFWWAFRPERHFTSG